MNPDDPIQQTPAPSANPAAEAFRTSGADAAEAAAAAPYAPARAPADAAAAFSGAPRQADATKFDESLVEGLPPEAASAVRENFAENLAAARDAVEGRARSRSSAWQRGRDAIADYTSRLLAEASAPPPEPAPAPAASSGTAFAAAKPKTPPLDANGIPDDGLSFFDDFLA